MANYLEIIPGKLYTPIKTIWVNDINLKIDVKLQPITQPILMLKYNTINDIMYLIFLIENKLYKTELYNNPGFYFKELLC